MQSHSGSARKTLAVRRFDATAVTLITLATVMPLHGQRAGASKTQTLQGEIRLAEPRAVSAQRIVLDDLRLVTNGHRFELTADIIEVRGAANIRAFEANGTERPRGEPGRSAGVILLTARRLVGPAIVIDNTGEDGAPGTPGEPGKPGAEGKAGVPREWKPWTGCVGGRDGDQGGPGGRGGDGGPGGPGGSGGVVVLDLVTGGGAIVAKAMAKGGRGGDGGEPGRGGAGGSGGAGAAGVATCGGTAIGRPGADGPSGERGKDGKDGAPGQVLDVSKRKSQRPPTPTDEK